MAVLLDIRNESTRKHMYRKAALGRIADSILCSEGVKEDVQISVLLCDDAFIKILNEEYCGNDYATDVLSFEQSSGADSDDFEDPVLLPGMPAVLGDIVISLETVERNCSGEVPAMRSEVKLLFCHGLLHLLGYDHGKKTEREKMWSKQAEYLDLKKTAAWPSMQKSN